MTRRCAVAAVGLGLLAACGQSGAAPRSAAAPTPGTTPTPAAGAAAPSDDASIDPDEATGDEEDEATGDEEAAAAGPYVAPGGHFTVEFPSEPTVTQRTLELPLGKVRLTSFLAEDDGRHYLVEMGSVVPRDRKQIDLTALSRAIRDENLAATTISRREEHAIDAGHSASGLPGLSISYQGTAGGAAMKGEMRVFARRAPLTIYTVHAIAPADLDDLPLRLFVESFSPSP